MTGVQTCALPIYAAGQSDARRDEHDGHNRHNKNQHELPALHHDGET